jgi:hypothetical protein
MEPIAISESQPGLFSALLPPCDVSILRRLLAPSVPYVWLIDHRVAGLAAWLEENLPPLCEAAVPREAYVVRHIELDLTLNTAVFLGLLPGLEGSGIDLLQATKPQPRNLHLRAVRESSQGRAFRDNGVVLGFHLPHPHEHALLPSPSREAIEQAIRRIDSGRPAMRGGGLIAAAKARPDVRLVEVTTENRDGLPGELEGWVRGQLKPG